MENENAWVDMTITRGPIRGKDRNRIGLIVRVAARRDVEDFMSGLAQGRRVQVDAITDGWYSCNPDGNSLEFYDGETSSREPRTYTLDNIGGPLLIQRDDPNVPQVAIRRNPAPAQLLDDMVNLSFLKLVGIGNESGVALGLVGAYSGDYIRKVKAVLPAAMKQFLNDYLVPITINLQIINKG